MLLFNKRSLSIKLLLTAFATYIPAFVISAEQALSVNVTSFNNKPIENIVVFIEPIDHEVTLQNLEPLEIGQKNQSFTPYISVMQLGSEVAFNNQDNITHQIYSPVGNNKFSVKIRAGQEVIKNDFNEAGVVSMGCNIHDWMSGYMLIVDTPYFAKTDKMGNTKINIEKAGLYKVNVWHPQMNEVNNTLTKEINVNSLMEVSMQLSKPMQPIPLQENEDDFDFLSDY